MDDTSRKHDSLRPSWGGEGGAGGASILFNRYFLSKYHVQTLANARNLGMNTAVLVLPAWSLVREVQVPR